MTRLMADTCIRRRFAVPDLCSSVKAIPFIIVGLHSALPTHRACAQLLFDLTASSLPGPPRPGEPSAHCADMSAPLVTAEVAQPASATEGAHSVILRLGNTCSHQQAVT